MALIGRGKKEVLIGSSPVKVYRTRLRRRLVIGIVLFIGCSLVFLALFHERRSTQLRIARLDIEKIASASRHFRQDFGRCPHDINELAHPPAGGTPYISKAYIDPWGREYVFECPSRWDENKVDVATKGPDGQWFGDDDLSTDL